MKMELWSEFNEVKLKSLAELFVQEYAREPWNEKYQPEEVVAAYRRDLERPGIRPGVVASYEGGKVAAYTAGMMMGVNDVAQITEMMIEAPYLGGVLGEERTRAELGAFWQSVAWVPGVRKVLFIYDTLRNQDNSKSLSPWLETAVAVCEWALEAGVSQFVGVTTEGTKILQMLEAMKTVTQSRSCETGGQIQPVLVFSQDLTRVKRVFAAARRGIQDV